MKAKFNDGTEEFKDQCVAYKRLCPDCGTRFKPDDVKCPNCGAPRPRCKNRAMAGEEVCRSHAHGRPYSLYSRLAAALTDAPLEELLDEEKLRDLDEPYVLAKIALSSVFDEEDKPDSEKIIGMVKQFFIIAEKKRNIESGKMLNIAWDDKTLNILRARVKKYFITLKQVLDRNIQDEDLKLKILKELHDEMKLVGNQITAPDREEFYKEQEDA